jgi:hypothetical protein
MKPSSKASGASSDRRTFQKSEPPQPAIVASDANWTGRWPGWLVLCAGWLIPQLLLLGPALVGRTVDLPVDLLGTRNLYLPNRPEYANIKPQNGDDLFDLLLIGPATVGEFYAKEVRAGRLPMWQPSNFAGAPCVASYSPFWIPYYIAPHPITLAWIAVLQALTIGLGMWLLLRRSFELSFWPAAIGSWCAPLTGFMTVWHGFSLVGPFCWLPWSLLAADAAVKRPGGYASVGVAVVSALILLSGHPGIAGLVLLTTGLYVLWLLAEEIRNGQRWQITARSASAITLAWALGFLLSAPYLVPLLDYTRTGARTQSRSESFEERPPQGLVALPAIVLPDFYGGNVRANWQRVVRTVLPESSSGAYAGLLAALWLAPLAFCDRKRRSRVIFLALLIFVSLGWTLNVPGIVDVLRSKPLQPLAALSYNRWVLATSLAIVILAAIGLEHLRNTAARFRWWFLIPMLTTASLGCWCLYRRVTMSQFNEVFTLCYAVGVGGSFAALIGWVTTIRQVPYGKWIRLGVICLLPVELFWFAWNERRQADMSLYFPRIPVLEKLAALPAGRIWGVSCFPPNLNLLYGLDDVRGYDAVDPADFVRLFDLAVDRQRSTFPPYAVTQYAVPLARQTTAGVHLHPVADLLGVRYLIYRERPGPEMPLVLQEDDYWITENRNALPRAFVPRTVRSVKDNDQAIREMGSFDFDPSRTAFVTDDLRLPDAMQGQVTVHPETPTRSEIAADMQTAGLVLVSDMWDAGWHAELDGEECPIYRVDVALRGFQVPAGKHRIVCTYRPQSVKSGFRAAAAGGLILLLWVIAKVRRNRWNRSGVVSIGELVQE